MDKYILPNEQNAKLISKNRELRQKNEELQERIKLLYNELIYVKRTIDSSFDDISKHFTFDDIK